MIDAILNFEKSPSGFLRRQKVNRQLLFDYLVRQGEYPDVKATKETLVNNVLYLWNSSSIRTRPRVGGHTFALNILRWRRWRYPNHN